MVHSKRPSIGTIKGIQVGENLGSDLKAKTNMTGTKSAASLMKVG
jgi:hypothetical protein